MRPLLALANFTTPKYYATMTKGNNLNKLAFFLFEIGSLRKIPRSHMQTLLTHDLSDNIASHTFRVALIGYFLAKQEKADPYKTLLMCLIHDLSEARSGDKNWVHKKYVKVFENEITQDQFQQLPSSTELLQLSQEYSERKTLESKIAKDADLVDQLLLEKEYSWAGNQEAREWSKSKSAFKSMSTTSAKRLAKLVYKTRPSAWWWGNGNTNYTSKRR